MNKRFSLAHTISFPATFALLCMLAIGVSTSFAQKQQSKPVDNAKPYYDLAKPIAQEDSRAQKEADRLVSLSADRIISLLNDEPGLFLECKKLLVRTAFEQGRVLDPEDLDDETVFRLVREDQNVRVLFTREIEDRSYIRAKPTREELARLTEQGIPTQTLQAGAVAGLQTGKSQENSFWSQRGGNATPRIGSQDNGTTQSPAQNPSPTAPAVDPRRLLLQAQAAQGQSSATESGGFSGALPQITPDQVSALLAAKMSGGGLGGSPAGEDETSPFSRGLDMDALASGGLGISGMGLGSSIDPYAGKDSDEYQPSSHPAPPPRAAGPEKQPSLVRRANPYADVPSLYDLYSQYSRKSLTVDRFGDELFHSGTGNLDSLPMDLPVGPDYVLGPGDGLNIDLFGSAGQRLKRVVSRQGQIALPDVGDVQVAGKTLGYVQHMVQAALRTQFRDVEADVSLTKLRSVRIYVVGDVQRPGAYDVSSLSTPLSAVYEAGGPTSQGSLRLLKQYRGKELVQQVDVYDLLLHGVNGTVLRLSDGDTIMVSPLGPQVTVQGMVRRPAIYELNGETNLAQVLELAGGVLPSGTLRHVDVERLVAHETRTMLRLDIPETNNQESVTKTLEDFKIQDGDKVQISPILPYTERTVYLDGYVFRPGKFAYREGMRVTDLIKSYKDLLPEPYKEHAEIIRLRAPDHTPEVLAFNLDDAISGNDQDLVLQPFDTVRVFGRFDFEDQPVVTVTGEVRDPGDHVTNGAIHLKDAIYLAGNLNSDAQLDDAQVFRKTQDGKLEVISVNLTKALEGDAKDNILLEPKDRVFVHKNLDKADPPTVTVAGEVGRPGKYPLGGGMTAADLVRFAGGLKRSAYTEAADLTSYMVENGDKVVSDHRMVPIAKALAGEPDSDARLHDGDVLTIRQLAGWNDRGAKITVRGEVMHPGTYGIEEGERLSSILQRAGGFSSDAYPYGVLFERAQVRDLEIQNRAELIRRVKGEQAEVTVMPGGDQEEVKQAALLQYQSTLEKLESTPPVGRLVIHISSNVKRWANTAADIPVRDGDVILIPKKPNMVIVDGAVYNPTAIAYKPGRNVGWYLNQTGGPTQLANKKGVFVIRADGSVVGGPGGLFTGGVEKAELQPGDMVMVPEKTFSISHKFQNTVQAAQIFAAIGVAAQAAFYVTH